MASSSSSFLSKFLAFASNTPTAPRVEEPELVDLTGGDDGGGLERPSLTSSSSSSSSSSLQVKDARREPRTVKRGRGRPRKIKTEQEQDIKDTPCSFLVTRSSSSSSSTSPSFKESRSPRLRRSAPSPKRRISSLSPKMRHLRCAFCCRSQLDSPPTSSSFHLQLMEITPSLSVHKQCLETSNGLAKEGHCTSEEVKRELQRCQDISCNFCRKVGGASVQCMERGCSNSFHLACFYDKKQDSPGSRGQQMFKVFFCSVHLNKNDRPSPSKRPGPASKCKNRKTSQEAEDSGPVTVKPEPGLQVPSKYLRSRLCNAVTCVCPRGVNFVNGGSWSLRFCTSCGHSSAHSGCLVKKEVRGEAPPTKWQCRDCSSKSASSSLADDSAAEEEQMKKKKIEAVALTMMKSSFCKDIDSHFRKRTERSPLSMRQKREEGEESDSPSKTRKNDKGNNATDVCTFKLPDLLQSLKGKENKRLRKDRSKWIVKVRESEPGPNPREEETTTKEANATLSPDNNKKQSSDKKAKLKKSSKGTKGSSSKTSQLLPSSPVKKFVSNSPGNSPVKAKKGKKSIEKADTDLTLSRPNDADAAKRTLVKKDLKPVEERTLFHVRSTQMVQHGEPEALECYQWLTDLSLKQIDEFVDLNDGEKEFMKMWNRHTFAHPCHGDKMMFNVLKDFIKNCAREVLDKDLYCNFVLHVNNLLDFGIVSRLQAYVVIQRMQRKMVNCDLDSDAEPHQQQEEEGQNKAGESTNPKRKRKKSSTPESSPKRKMRRRSCTIKGGAKPNIAVIANEGADFAAAAFKSVLPATPEKKMMKGQK